MSADASEQFSYPVGNRVLRSIEEYRDAFLPAMHDLERLNRRIRHSIDLLATQAQGEGLRVLDYGCGGGTFVYHLAQRRPDWRIEGWEGDYSSFEIARHCFAAENIAHFRKPYGAYRELEPDSFDAIAFLEVIEHVDNPGEILDAFHRALRPGGLLLISTPNFLGWQLVIQELRRNVSLAIGRRQPRDYAALLNTRAYDPTTDSGHIVVYSFDTLGTLLKARSFELLDYALARQGDGVLSRLFPDTLIMIARKPENAG